ncbi:MAG: pyridoxal phosphate-dependent aminotransferase [Proteobacteria bacterium]|nr:pyridoxal phosphate-dependent aminotransferase [Pseudomonadota bacterium]
MSNHPAPALLPVNQAALDAPSSGIVEVFNYGRNKPGLLPLWVGEGDRPTPAFIQEAAVRSLQDGETFYTYQRGIPALREAIAGYLGTVYGQTLSPERFFVTCGGMHALQIAMRIVSGAGDEVIVPTPAWPNFTGAITVNGARPREVELVLKDGRFTLDPEALSAAITERTRAICLNTPANPSGWTATRGELEQVLALARRHGLWIIADEIYGRFFYSGARAPSFRDIMDEDDRILFVQTFSKNWAMTGWRIGWLEAPPALGQIIENLIQYSTSGVAVPLQRGGIAALTHGEPLILEQRALAEQNRALLLDAFRGINGLTVPDPSGAFYLFLRVEGMTDSLNEAMALIDSAGVGLAPGSAFGAGGEGFFRLCYLRNSKDIAEAARRLRKALLARR